MFISVRRCAEPMTQLPRLKVKVTEMVIRFTLEFCVRFISPHPLKDFHQTSLKCFSQRDGVQNPLQICRLKVNVFTLDFRVHYISPKPFERFSLNFTQMFLSRWCLDPMTQLRRLKVNLQCNGIYP